MKYSENYIQLLDTTIDEIIHSETEKDQFRNKAILVTGAGGLICSAIIDVLIWLNRKHLLNLKIYAAGRNEEGLESRFLRWKKGQDYFFYRYDAMLPLKENIKIDFIIHGASNASPRAYVSEPVETILANFIGVQNLLELLRKEGHGRFLYISTSEVYGQKDSNEPYSEEDYGYIDILNPRACYPVSKRAAETLCVAYKKEYGVDFVTVRPGHIYGPTMTEKDDRASSQFARDVATGKNIIMKSAGIQLRSYCYVLDCVTAILTVLLKGQSGEAYNISNPNSIVTIRELAECIAEIGGVNLLYDNPTDSEKESYNLMRNSSLASGKLENLGWTGRFGLKDGVKATLESI